MYIYISIYMYIYIIYIYIPYVFGPLRGAPENYVLP